MPRISISTSPSPVPGSSITSAGKPKSLTDCAISSGVIIFELYLTSAFAANSATNMLSTPVFSKRKKEKPFRIVLNY